MDQNLLRSYFGTVYELPSDAGLLRVSLEGDAVKDASGLPPLLRQEFAILTAYNPRSMLLPRRVNDGRHQVLRDLLILGCNRVEHCVGYDDEPKASGASRPGSFTASRAKRRSCSVELFARIPSSIAGMRGRS